MCCQHREGSTHGVLSVRRFLRKRKEAIVRFVAKSTHDAEMMDFFAKLIGLDDEPDCEVSIWTGVVPPNSYMRVAPGVNMSTPEFYLFRKMAMANDVDARTYACELFGTVKTSLTSWRIPEGHYTTHEPDTTPEYMRAYLSQIPEDKSAKRVLRLIEDMDLSLVVDYARFVSGCYEFCEVDEDA